MELQAFSDFRTGETAESRIMEIVKGMDDRERLGVVTNLMTRAADADEMMQGAIVAAWRLVEREEWWRAGYVSWVEFESDVSENIKDMIRRTANTARLKKKFEGDAAAAWGTQEGLRQVFGSELIRESLGMVFLEKMKTLARLLPDINVAKRILLEERDRRLSLPGRRKDVSLQPRDVEAALKRVRSGEGRTIGLAAEGPARGIGDRAEEECVRVAGVEVERASEGQLGGEEEWTEREHVDCQCENLEATEDVILRVKECMDLEAQLAELNGLDRRDWRRICHRHIRVIGSALQLQTSRLDRDKLIDRMVAVQGLGVAELWSGDESHEWFRKRGRPEHPMDGLGPFKYARIEAPNFEFDRGVVWARYAGDNSFEDFSRDGNVVVRGLFDWIVKDEELMGMVDAEFEMYHHHLREQNGQPNLGWCRNMWHSLVQQAIRQDPVFYALNVAVREDNCWRLVSFPYYTKFVHEGDSTSFKHIDINIPALLRCGRGGNVVQTAVSLDDESNDGCTLIVPGFHKHIREWWGKVRERREDTNGASHSVDLIYSPEDAAIYGKFITVKCRRGDVRMTKAQIIHGSTGKGMRVRRVVFPWLVGLEEDHEAFEMSGVSPWSEVSAAHRDMAAMNKGPTGQAHRFGLGEGRFAGSVEMRGISALGDALVGARRWDSGTVLKERNLVLGLDDEAAWKHVESVRREMKKRWIECFIAMVQVEEEAFGESSYFRKPKGSARLGIERATVERV